MGIARFLIILVVHVTDIRCQFLFIDGNGKGNIPAKTQNGNDIGDTLDRRTGTADEEQGIVDTLPVKMSINFAERQCFIDIIGCKMDRLFLQVSFTLIQIFPHILFCHFRNRLPFKGHHGCGFALGGKKAARSGNADTNDHGSYFFQPVGMFFDAVFLPVTAAVLFHSFFTCFFFVLQFKPCLYCCNTNR